MPRGQLRNIFYRPTHKERHQPTHRKHLGILEKKSDYRKRAKAHHERQDEIQNLRNAAFYKNPDEYHPKMLKYSTGIDGKLVKQKTPDFVETDPKKLETMKRLLFTRNKKYIDIRRIADERRIEKLEASSSLKPSEGIHTVFQYSDEEQGVEENHTKMGQTDPCIEDKYETSHKEYIKECAEKTRKKITKLKQRRDMLWEVEQTIDRNKQRDSKLPKELLVTDEGVTVYRFMNRRQK